MDNGNIDVNVVTDLNALSADKQAMVKEAKDDALVKIASFDGRFQDPYPSPFLNLTDTQIPRSTVEIFRWCKYFYTFDPLIAGAINALSGFPVTEIYLEDKNQKEENKESDTLKTYKRVMFKSLNIYKLLIEIGIDYFLYGNCFIFGEIWDNPVTNEKEWKSMTRLDPNKMIIDYNPATHDKKYKWQVPLRVQEICKKKSPKDEYEKIPDVIKEAVKKRQTIVLNPDNVFHFSRATDSMGDNSIWGTPIVANVMKLLMYRNILRQAQEAIAREHIVPMRVYYLEKTDSYNWEADWNKVALNFAQELNKSVRDPNHKVVSPVPVNVVNVGGDGRSLLLTPEIQQVQEEILAGMNVPREFIFGGVSYSGSSISLKILENQFITYRLLLKDFMQNFVIRGMAKARKEWVSEDDDDALLTVKMQDLKMQDDVQQKQVIVQLNSAGKCSNELMWQTLGIDAEKMRETLEKEAIAAVELEAKINTVKLQLQFPLQKMQLDIQMQLRLYQMELEKKYGVSMIDDPNNDPNNSGAAAMSGATTADSGNSTSTAQGGAETPETPGTPDTVDGSDEYVQNIALKLIKMNDKTRQQVLSKLPSSAQQKVMKAIAELENTAQSKEKSKVDMRPMPTKLPPRRDSLK